MSPLITVLWNLLFVVPSVHQHLLNISVCHFFVESDWLFNPIKQKLVVCRRFPSLPRRKKEEEKTLSWLIRTPSVLFGLWLNLVFPVPARSFLDVNSKKCRVSLIRAAHERWKLSRIRNTKVQTNQFKFQLDQDSSEGVQLLKASQYDWSVLDIPHSSIRPVAQSDCFVVC